MTAIVACRTVPFAVVAVSVNRNAPGTMLLSVIMPDAGAGAVSVVAVLAWSTQPTRRRCSGDESFTIQLTSNATPTLTGVDGPVATIAKAVGVGAGAVGEVGV